ncbi:MAG TPA: hypothetical protein VFV23_10880 [Verrucomicrobiae bacterium]|nr:hypothetical protein [Verrucomicrobiae bacterium]
MNHAEHYQLKLAFIREMRNPHQGQAPYGAPFLVVGPGSPKSWRKEVEKLAYYFRREMHYDFPPYTASEAEYSLDVLRDRVLIFTNHHTTEKWERVFYLIGAVGVRWRKWEDAPHGWSVAWVWFHPYERRKGHLTKAWPFLLEMFPKPHVEPPISDAMKRFLLKVGYYDSLIDYEI